MTSPADISSVRSDNLLGAKMDIMEPNIARVKATIIKIL